MHEKKIVWHMGWYHNNQVIIISGQGFAGNPIVLDPKEASDLGRSIHSMAVMYAGEGTIDLASTKVSFQRCEYDDGSSFYEPVVTYRRRGETEEHKCYCYYNYDLVGSGWAMQKLELADQNIIRRAILDALRAIIDKVIGAQDTKEAKRAEAERAADPPARS